MGVTGRVQGVRKAPLGFLLIIATWASAQSPPSAGTLPGFRMEKPPKIDGIVEEQEWAGAPRSAGGYDDETGAPSREEASYRIAYDTHYIYFAVEVRLTDPKSVRANEYRTNVGLEGDDYAGIVIDPFGNLTDRSLFGVNPAGATTIEIAGGRAAKREWLGEMDARGRITESGYEVEARIPWSILKLPEAGVRDLRISFFRWDPREQRTYHWTDISGLRRDRMGRWLQVEIPRIDTRQVVQALPYVYGGLDERRHLLNAGVDFKARISQDLDLIGSVNPDFRNIESSVLSLDFSYFERLGTETRPFFLEGAQYFVDSRETPLFVSQRIRSFDVGVKTFGKISEKTTVAALDAIDFGRRNAFVANVSHSLGPRSTVQAALASRVDPGLSNTGSFLGFTHGFGPLYVFGQHMRTWDTEVGSGHRYNLGLSYYDQRVDGGVEYLEISPSFLPRLGFAPRKNLKGVNANAAYEVSPRQGPVRTYGIGFYGAHYRTFEGTHYQTVGNGSVSMTLRSGLEIEAMTEVDHFLANRDRLSAIEIEYPSGDPYRNLDIGYAWGRIAGDDYSSLFIGATYRLQRRLQLSSSYQRVRHAENEEQFILSASWDLDHDQAFSGRLVRSGRDTNAYLAYRRSGNRGAEYYVILGDPHAKTFRAALVLKAVFPLQIRFGKR